MTSASDFDVVGREPGNGAERCELCGSRRHMSEDCPIDELWHSQRVSRKPEVEGEDTASIRAGTMTSNAGDVVQSAWSAPSSLFSIAEIDALVTSGA